MLDAFLLLLAQASAEPDAAKPPVTVESASDDACEKAAQQDSDTRTITVCAQRPQGYRLNPDVMAAKRAARRSSKPRPPEGPKGAPGLCENIGGCRGLEGVDLVGVGLAAARLAARAAQGESLRQLFETGKELSEYELYLLAKAEREAREEEEAADRMRAETKAKDAAAGPASVADEGPKP